MSRKYLFILIALLSSLNLLPHNAYAQHDPKQITVTAIYDQNHNGSIDSDEKEGIPWLRFIAYSEKDGDFASEVTNEDGEVSFTIPLTVTFPMRIFFAGDVCIEPCVHFGYYSRNKTAVDIDAETDLNNLKFALFNAEMGGTLVHDRNHLDGILQPGDSTFSDVQLTILPLYDQTDAASAQQIPDGYFGVVPDLSSEPQAPDDFYVITPNADGTWVWRAQSAFRPYSILLTAPQSYQGYACDADHITGENLGMVPRIEMTIEYHEVKICRYDWPTVNLYFYVDDDGSGNFNSNVDRQIGHVFSLYNGYGGTLIDQHWSSGATTARIPVGQNITYRVYYRPECQDMQYSFDTTFTSTLDQQPVGRTCVLKDNTAVSWYQYFANVMQGLSPSD